MKCGIHMGIGGWISLLVIVVLLGGLAHAVSPFETETWDTDTAGWIGQDPLNGSPISLTNPSDYLSVSFGAQSQPAPEVKIIRALCGSASDRFTGNYWGSAIVTVSFRFQAMSHAPGDLKLYLYSETSKRWWYVKPAAPTVGEWTDYSIALDYSAGWRLGVGGTEAQFLADLKTISWIGIQIQRSSVTAAQTYGLDDFVLSGARRDTDSDGDGASDFQEVMAGTDRNSPSSILAIKIRALGGPAGQGDDQDGATGLELRWPSVANRLYTIERTDDLTEGFTAITTGITPTLPENVYVDETAVGPGPHFYRVSVKEAF